MAKYNLLDSQLGFYYGNKLCINKSTYNTAEYVEINHSLDIVRMKHAIHEVINENPTLHIWFAEDNGIPYQHMEVVHDTSIELVDLSQQNGSIADALALMEEDATHPFLLDSPPLFRQKIVMLGENHYLWYFCSHHLLLDGYSTYSLINRVAEVYRNQPFKPPRMSQPTTLAALLKAESTYKASANYQADKHFWQTICTHLPEPATLANTNMPSGWVIRHAESFSCPTGFFLPQTNQPSWLSRVITAVMVYLYLCTGEKAQTIGIPMMARTESLTRHALICKTNVLPLALDVGETTTGLQLAQEIECRLKQIKKHQTFRYENIKSMWGHASDSPLFNVVVNIIPFESATLFSAAQRSLVRNLRSGGAQDIVFNIRPDIDNQTLRLEIDADSGLYDRSSLVRHSQALQKLCALLHGENGQKSIWQLRQYFPLSVYGTESGGNVVDIIKRIECIIAQSPQRPAICTPEHPSPSLRNLSYGLLREYVTTWAAILAPICTPNTALLLDLSRGPEAVICMLVSLQLNIPFVNLNTGAGDVEYCRLLEQFHDAILITERTFKRYALISTLPHWQNLTLFPSGDYENLTFFRHQKPDNNAVLPVGISYVMFTSGTTGTPKGVMCSRYSLNVFTAAAVERYGVGTHDRILQFAPLYFDASIEEIFVSLASGASLYIAPGTTILSFPALFQFCVEHSLSLLDLPTAYFNEMLFALSDDLMLPPTIRTVIVGGERLSERTRELWFSLHPSGIRLINSYGPTEATVVSTTAVVKNDDNPVTIGEPLTGIFIAIVGENLEPVPLGSCGELLIVGATVCAGYLNQPSLSAEKFVSIKVNGQQLPAYRTGDIACMDHERQLVFIGRKVRETKISGQRINMNEIEVCIATMLGIIEVAVLAKHGDAGVMLYAHYYGMQPLEELTLRTLYGKLPNSHIPKHFIHHRTPLAKLPNGKIDYRTLERCSRELAPKYRLHSTTFKTLVQEIWLEILGSDDRDFFALGGDSLQAIKIVNVLNAYCQLDLNLQDIFEYPGLSSFFRHVMQLAHTRYGLSQHHLDMRCAISRSLSSDVNVSETPALFIQSPEGDDERYLLDLLGARYNVHILTSEKEVRLYDEGPLATAVFNVPETSLRYTTWLDALPSLLHALSGRVQKLIFMYDMKNSVEFVQEALRGYRHDKLLLLHKADCNLRFIDAGITELIILSAQLGYFPHVQFDTTNERLSSCVLKSIGIKDENSVDHHGAFTAAQQKNPGIRLCDLSHWLNLISANSQAMST